jgi:hypothetical protein
MASSAAPDKNIQFLIDINYQRMVSFEQAAFLTNEPSFKEFYLAKAAESEINIQQLLIIMNTSPETYNAGPSANTADVYLAEMFNGKKSATRILASIKTFEKTSAKWYKNILKEITDLPKEMIELVKEQYKSLNSTQLQMEML